MLSPDPAEGKMDLSGRLSFAINDWRPLARHRASRPAPSVVPR